MDVRELRHAKGFTQQKLAEKCGISQQAIQQYENGERTPSLGVLSKLSDVLDISFECLIKALPERRVG